MKKRWENISPEKRISAGLAFVAFLLVVAVLNIWVVNRRYGESARWVAHTHEVLLALQECLSAVREAESSQRGYLLTGEKAYLRHYGEARNEAASLMLALQGMVGDNAEQQKRIGEMRELAEERFKFSDRVISVADTDGVDRAREEMLAGQGLQAMEKVRQVASELRTSEEALLQTRKDRWRFSNRELLWSLWIELAVCVIVLVLGYFWIKTELAARKRLALREEEARQAAERSTELKSSFLANMSHEIRTPMNGIIGMTGLLLDTELESRQREYAETVKSCADSLLVLINDILDFSKIEAGKLNFEVTDFELAETVESVMDMLAESAHRKGLELASFIDDRVPVVVGGDPGRLRQVLINLVGNAIKFTEQGEVLVNVSLKEDSGRTAKVLFQVRDTGIGISREAQAQLFQPFFQSDASMARKYGGTGLGLAICRQIVNLMGGTLSVDSELGRGSSFNFEVGFEKREHPSANMRKERAERLRGMKVLVVDDNETNRRILAEQTANWGLESEQAASAAEVWRLLRAATEQGSPFELLVLDYQMPGCDGIVLARELLGDPVFSRLKIVLLTSIDHRESEWQNVSNIVTALTKPARPSQLYNAVLNAAGAIVSSGDGSRRPKFRAARRTGPLPQIGGLSQKKVLVAEDNPVNQRVVLELLKQLGCSAEAVGDGNEVLQAIQQIPYDIIIMDCQMPHLDGFGATRAIREWEEQGSGYRPYIMALTANAMAGDRERCLESGMDDYLAKPVRADELRAALERSLAPAAPDAAAGPVESPPPEAEAPVPAVDAAAIEAIWNLDEDGSGNLARELIRTYLEDGEARLAAVRDLVAVGDDPSASREAHALKGASANFGATRLVELCRRLEREYPPEPAAAASLVEEVAGEFGRVRGELEKWMT